MRLFKKNKILLINLLTLNFIIFCKGSHIYGSEEENIVPSRSLEKNSCSSGKMPLSVNESFLNLPAKESDKAYDKANNMENASKSEEILQDHQVLRLRGGVGLEELKLLQDKTYKAISLNAVYLDTACENANINKYFCEQNYLKISAEIVNPEVQILSLNLCGLKDKHIEKINEFSKLRQLFLNSNGITDRGIEYIVQLENLETLTLVSNYIGNPGFQKLLGMHSLTNLDISRNKEVDDQGAIVVLDNKRIRKLDISFTGITRAMNKKIKEECKNLEDLKYFPSPGL